MDINTLRIAVTVVSMAVFLGIVAWAYAGRNRARFDELGQLPFLADPAGDKAQDEVSS